MDEYKPNSHRSKEGARTKEPEATEKVVRKVVSGSTKVKKKGELQKFAGAIFSEDLTEIKADIMSGLVIPTVKTLIVETVKTMMWGAGGYDRRAGGGVTASRVNYNSISRDYDRRDRGSNRPGSVRPGSGLDYDNIVFDNRGDAEVVLGAMWDYLDEYQNVSVGDMYGFADVTTTNYMVNRIGWYDLGNAQVVRVQDGYMIRLPKAQILK